MGMFANIKKFFTISITGSILGDRSKWLIATTALSFGFLGNAMLLFFDLINNGSATDPNRSILILLSTIASLVMLLLALRQYKYIIPIAFCLALADSTFFIIESGSIRYPTTAVFLTYIFLSAIFFGHTGIRITTIFSTIIVGILGLAEFTGLMIPHIGPITTMPVLMYILYFVIMGFLVNYFFGLFEISMNENKKLTAAVEQSSGSIMIIGLNQTIEYVNHRFSDITGFSSEELIGKRPRDILNLKFTEAQIIELWATLKAGKEWKGETPITSKSGQPIIELTSATPLKNDQGNITNYLVFSEDITERIRSEQTIKKANLELTEQLAQIRSLQKELKEQTLRDPLTGVYNRRYFDEIIEREFERVQRDGIPLSIMMLDMDHFKTINDTFGHAAGDLVLKTAAKALTDSIRPFDFCCRFGGEEFILVLPGLSPEFAESRANYFRQLLENLTIPWQDKSIQVTASFGIAITPNHGTSPTKLLRMADEAMYRSKLAGRNRVTLWNPQLS
jgi:diguanylate cyclase (GGDEF)-like protein/PAS domain S-box-containing protein